MHNQEFVAMPADEVVKLLANDNLNVMNEEMVFHALVLWAKHDMANRKKHLAKLLVHIKLPLLPPQVRHIQNALFRHIVCASSKSKSLSQMCRVFASLQRVHIARNADRCTS